MKIVFINTTDNKGGASDLALSLKDGLKKQGHEVTIFVRSKYSQDPDIIPIKGSPSLITKWLSKITGKDIGSYISNKLHWLLSNDIEFFNNRSLLESKELKEADVVHCHNLHGIYFNLKLLEKISQQKPIFWSLHDMWAFNAHEVWNIDKSIFVEAKPHLFFNNRKYLLHKKKNIYKKSKLHLIVASNWILEILKTSILKEQPAHLIYNGIKAEEYIAIPKIEARKKIGLPLDKKIISFMAHGGKDNTQKGWKYAEKIIEHYKKNNNILFLCIGGDPKVDPTNKNIAYIKYLKKPELALYCSASDVFINPSLAENFCLMLITAMSCGLPAVSFSVGIAPEAIEHKKNGYLANYKDGDDLIRGVEYILNLNNDAMSQMKKLAIESSKKFTLEQMVNEHIALYEKILKEYNKK